MLPQRTCFCGVPISACRPGPCSPRSVPVSAYLPSDFFWVARTRFCADLWGHSSGIGTQFPFYMSAAEKASAYTQRIRDKLAKLRAVPVSAQTHHGCRGSAWWPSASHVGGVPVSACHGVMHLRPPAYLFLREMWVASGLQVAIALQHPPCPFLRRRSGPVLWICWRNAGPDKRCHRPNRI